MLALCYDFVTFVINYYRLLIIIIFIICLFILSLPLILYFMQYHYIPIMISNSWLQYLALARYSICNCFYITGLQPQCTSEVIMVMVMVTSSQNGEIRCSLWRLVCLLPWWLGNVTRPVGNELILLPLACVGVIFSLVVCSVYDSFIFRLSA